MCTEQIAVWPDAEWCYVDELEAQLMPPCAKSDDYIVLNPGICTEDQIQDFVERYLAC